MSRILIAWEMGANYGHLSRCLNVAAALRESGHAVSFAVRDTRGAAELMGEAGFDILQSPLPSRPRPSPARPPANYAEILLGEGYGDPLGLRGMVMAWMALLRLTGAELLLADHAPTALVAARIARIPALPIGNGFAIPPRCSPWPSIRAWETIPAIRLQEADRRVKHHIDQVLGHFGGPGLADLNDLFGKAPLLDTLAELDHYGERPDGRYIGPIVSFKEARSVAWQGTADRRIVAYLRPGTAGFAAMFDALRASPAEVLAVIPGLSAAHARQLATRRLRVATAPVSLPEVLVDADVIVSHGGSGVVAESLMQGVPQLVLSRYVEQHMLGLRVEQLGTGIALGADDRQPKTVSEYLARVLDEADFRRSARQIADKYRHFRPGQAVAEVVHSVETGLGM